MSNEQLCSMLLTYLAGTETADFFIKQREWSHQTFGPPEHRGPNGPLKHLAKEAEEAVAETNLEKKKTEIADCLFLVFDATHRAGMSLYDLVRAAQEKLRVNKEERTWPDWRKCNPEQPIEHDRSKD